MEISVDLKVSVTTSGVVTALVLMGLGSEELESLDLTELDGVSRACGDVRVCRCEGMIAYKFERE